MRVKPRTGKGGPRSTEIEETQVTVRMAPTDGGSPAKVAIKVAPSAWLSSQVSGKVMEGHCICWLYCTGCSFLSALAYGATSCAMVFLNKGVLMTYKHSMTVLTLQMAVSAVLMQAASMFKWIPMRPFNWSTARALLPVAFFYNANVGFALASLEGVNVPMYIALKRLTPMAILIVNFFSGKTRPPLQVTLSVTTTVTGCVIAALGDFSFNPYGYGMALTSVLFQTAYLVLVERSGAEDGLSSFELLLYNAVLSLPVLIVMILLTGEAQVSFPLLLAKMSESSGFATAMTMSLIMGIVLNYTMFLCTIVNSALTTTIVGVLKGVVTTSLGFFILGGVEVRALNVTGLAINTFGGIWYSVAKYRQKQNKGAHASKTAKGNESEPLLPTSSHPPDHKA